MDLPTPTAPGGAYQLGRFTLEPRRQLLESGRAVPLGGKALDLLSVLAEAEGNLVTKDELMAAVWPGIVVEENAIQVHISTARKAIAGEADRLVTVRGRGYRLQVVRCPVATPPSPTSAPIASVAVLAFANLTGDSGNDYISDGIAEELITTLTRSSDLQVPAHTSSFAYKERDIDVRTIGRDLAVAAVLEGSLRTSGGRMRVTAQLIETRTGYHLWAQSFDRTDGDLLALQDDIAAAIVRALHAKISGSPLRTHDPEAFALNMQARALAGQLTSESLEHAITLQEQAIARDPGYAQAWVGLAGTLMVASLTGLLPVDRRFEARTKVEEAIRLDRGNAAPYAIRAVLDAGSGSWLDAEHGFGAAIELDPRNPTVREARAFHLLAPAGLIERARSELAIAIGDAPAVANLHVAQAALAVLAGDVDTAEAALDMARLLGVSDDRSSVQLLRGDIARAKRRWREAGELTVAAVAQWPGLGEAGAPELAAKVFAAVSGAFDKSAASAAILTFAARNGRDGNLQRAPAAAGRLMVWQLLLGSVDGAYRIGERLIEDWRRTGQLAGMSLNQLWRPEMQAFRDDPRFGGFVAALGLPAVWKRIGAPPGYAQLIRGSNSRGGGGTAAA